MAYTTSVAPTRSSEDDSSDGFTPFDANSAKALPFVKRWAEYLLSPCGGLLAERTNRQRRALTGVGPSGTWVPAYFKTASRISGGMLPSTASQWASRIRMSGRSRSIDPSCSSSPEPAVDDAPKRPRTRAMMVPGPASAVKDATSDSDDGASPPSVAALGTPSKPDSVPAVSSAAPAPRVA